MTQIKPQLRADRRAGRIRNDLKSTGLKNGRKRLSVFRSNSHIYAQLIDDAAGRTIASASSLDKSLRDSVKGVSIEAAQKVGEEIAQRATKAGVRDIYFDRGGFRYQGRVKALADGARQGGLNF